MGGIISLHTEYLSVIGVSLSIQSECGKMRARITLNTDTFYAVLHSKKTVLDLRETKQNHTDIRYGTDFRADMTSLK